MAHPLSRRPSPIALLALLFPLLAACGASGAPTAALAPTAPSTPPVADAFTAAPAPTAAPALGAAEPAGRSASSAPGAPPAEPAGGPPQPIPVAQQQAAPLRAGEVDDNADFDGYLQYLNAYSGPPARFVDVSERIILTVVNDRQQPVLDARVRVFDGQQQMFTGRTTSGGQTILFPRALGAAGANELRVLVDKGGHAAEGRLARGQGDRQAIVLPGANGLAEQPKLDVLFLLDATGSMGDEIGQIQRTIAEIAGRVGQIQPQPRVRYGLVAYRDRGDEYVTRVSDFTGDLGAFRETLLAVRAEGGGDTPESLNEALHQAVQGVTWSDDAIRLIFLVADAPPHLDYPQDYDYVQETRAAVAKGLKIFPIAASNSDDQAEYVFRQLAQQTLGTFIFLTYQPGINSGAPGDATVHHVDPAVYTVDRLDDLVVQAIQRELARASAAG